MINIKLLYISVIPAFLGFWLGSFISKNCADTRFIFDITDSIKILGSLSIVTILLVIFGGIFLILNENRMERMIFCAVVSILFAAGMYIPAGFYNNSVLLIAAGSLVLIFLGLYNFDAQLGSTYRNLIKATFTKPIAESSRSFFIFISLVVTLNFYMINSDPEVQTQLIDNSVNMMVDPIVNQSQSYIMDQAKQYNIESLSDSIAPAMMENAATGMAESTKNSIKSAIEPYKPNIIYILTGLVLISVYAALKFAGLLTTPLSYMIYLILKTGGFIKETTETVEVKRFTVY